MSKHLGIYLHDHLAGATAALTLLETLATDFSDHPVRPLLRRLSSEISWERGLLEGIAAAFPLATASPRRFGAWVAEKGLELKLALDSARDEEFRLFEGLEALSVGIAGKRLLWRALSQQARTDHLCKGPDYEKLIAMAIQQRRAIEPYRMASSRKAFVGGAVSTSLDGRSKDTHA